MDSRSRCKPPGTSRATLTATVTCFAGAAVVRCVRSASSNPQLDSGEQPAPRTHQAANSVTTKERRVLPDATGTP